MDIMKFGQQSFIGAIGLKERIEKAEKEKQMRNYRGLTKEGKWIYGWYGEDKNGKAWIYHKVATLDTSYSEVFTEVDPETVGQQVGLKDKNSKEAFKDDIARRHPNEHCFLVSWNDVECGFYLKSLSEKYPNQGMSFIEVCEILGNAHTTPELMEQDNGK